MQVRIVGEHVGQNPSFGESRLLSYLKHLEASCSDISKNWKSFWISRPTSNDVASALVNGKWTVDCLPWCDWSRYDQSEEDSWDQRINIDQQFYEDTYVQDVFDPECLQQKVHWNKAYIAARDIMYVTYFLF